MPSVAGSRARGSSRGFERGEIDLRCAQMHDQRGIRLERIVEREISRSDRRRSHARLYVGQGYPLVEIV